MLCRFQYVHQDTLIARVIKQMIQQRGRPVVSKHLIKKVETTGGETSTGGVQSRRKKIPASGRTGPSGENTGPLLLKRSYQCIDQGGQLITQGLCTSDSSDSVSQNTQLNAWEKELPELPPGECTRSKTKKRRDNAVSRERIGGKGYFLQCMQKADLSVPPFECVDTTMVKNIEDIRFDARLFETFSPEIKSPNSQTLSLTELKERSNSLASGEAGRRKQYLQALSSFIVSNTFYQQVQQADIASDIETLYRKLLPLYPNLSPLSQPIIVRSSSVKEDDYGDAQAGRYKSVVHQGGDILHSCLEVMASAYQPEVCTQGVPQPMAIILQQCIDCQFGGVVKSYASLQDNTVRIAYVPGQPKGAVAGLAGITPHRYDLKRQAVLFEPKFTPGDFQKCFSLKGTEGGEGFAEVEKNQAHDTNQKLTRSQLTALYQSIEKLENLLLCPVDVEFGIDHEGLLYLLQVRPITQLAGAMSFSMAAPKDGVVTGELAGDGLCSGILYLVGQKNVTQSFPEGAVLYADHGYDWMLEPGCLSKAGGFVFKHGSDGNHVSITLGAAKKPFLLAGSDQYEKVRKVSEKTVTLVAGRFRDGSGAYLLRDDQSESFHRAMDNADGTDYDQLLKTPLPVPEKPVFISPDTGFQWLNQQNMRLLEFYGSDRVLHLCLSPERCVQLSMSPRRTEVFQRLREETESLLAEAGAFLSGYQMFLKLDRSNNQEIASWLDELDELQTTLSQLDKNVSSRVSIMLNAISANLFRQEPESFNNWLDTSRELRELLQVLHQPDGNKDIQSLHDLIYFVHKRFVKALAPVALGSGSGQIHETSCPLELVDFTVSCPADSLLNEAIERTIRNNFDLNTTKVLNMPGALIVCLDLGTHQAVLEMLKTAEGGKKNILRIKFSDNLNLEESYYQGKLKRLWFIAQTLRALSLGGGKSKPDITFRENIGDIVIEYSYLPSVGIMQADFIKAMNVLAKICNFDVIFDNTCLDYATDCWNSTVLHKRLHDDRFQEINEWAFKFIIFLQAYDKASGYYGALSYVLENCPQYNSLIQFAEAAKDMAPEVIGRQLSDFFPEDTKEGLHLLLLVDPDKAKPLVSGDYQALFQDKKFFIKAVQQNWEVIRAIPREWVDEKLATIALEQNGMALKYAPDPMKNCEKRVWKIINRTPDAFAFAGDSLKDTESFVRCAISKRGRTIQFASNRFKDDETYQIEALRNDGGALPFVSERLRDDAETVLNAIQKNPNDKLLKHATKRLKNNEDFVLRAVREKAELFEFASKDIQDNPDMVLAAIGMKYKGSHSIRHCLPLKHASNRLKNNFYFMCETFKTNSACLKYGSEDIRENEQIALAAINRAIFSLCFVGKKLKNNVEFWWKVTQSNPSRLHSSQGLRTSDDLDPPSQNTRSNDWKKHSVSDHTRSKKRKLCSENELTHSCKRTKTTTSRLVRKFWHSSSFFELLGSAVKNDKNMALQAIKANYSSFKYASKRLRDDEEVARAAIGSSYRTLEFASERLRNKWSIVSLAVKENPEAWQWAGEIMRKGYREGTLNL